MATAKVTPVASELTLARAGEGRAGRVGCARRGVWERGARGVCGGCVARQEGDGRTSIEVFYAI